MSINNDYYQQIINDYPEYVTKEQFYKIAHISKKTAQYLLQSKKVPCVESNKKTRKYKIKVSDIVAYLIDRELRPGYYLPSYPNETIISSSLFLHIKMCSLNRNERVCFRLYLVKELEALDDILTIKDVSKELGFSYRMISMICNQNDIFSFLINGKRLIPKKCLIEYLSSPKGTLLTGKSTIYDSILSRYFCAI